MGTQYGNQGSHIPSYPVSNMVSIYSFHFLWYFFGNLGSQIPSSLGTQVPKYPPLWEPRFPNPLLSGKYSFPRAGAERSDAHTVILDWNTFIMTAWMLLKYFIYKHICVIQCARRFAPRGTLDWIFLNNSSFVFS